MILLPNDKDNSSLGVETQDVHFMIAGDSGNPVKINSISITYS